MCSNETMGLQVRSQLTPIENFLNTRVSTYVLWFSTVTNVFKYSSTIPELLLLWITSDIDQETESNFLLS